jgi:hypothetical protein
MSGKLLQADQQLSVYIVSLLHPSIGQKRQLHMTHNGKDMSQQNQLYVFPNLAGSDVNIWSSPQVQQENHICDDTCQ